jgi:hypothetical protein
MDCAMGGAASVENGCFVQKNKWFVVNIRGLVQIPQKWLFDIVYLYLASEQETDIGILLIKHKLDMAKSVIKKAASVPSKYHFLKRDLVGNFIGETLFQDSKFLGIILIPKVTDNRVGFVMKKFLTNSDRSIITDNLHERTAMTESVIARSKVQGLDFCFMDKVQLQWLLEQMGPNDKLCFADAYIDLGKTPPYLNSGGKKYPTLKAWVEKSSAPTTIERIRFVSKSSSATFPGFSILVPCPPIWPPYNKQELPGYFQIGT